MKYMDLGGKVAIVTGSTKGIGKGLAFALAERGASVVVVSRSPADCDRVASEIITAGGDAIGCSGDLTSHTEIKKIVDETLKKYERIDILINNAGAAITKRAEEITEEDWDRVIDIDLKSVFFCAQEVGKVMINQKSGKIINVASILGLVGDRQVLPYCVAKGGVVQMTKALALEWVKYNIQVNSLCPGYVITPMNKADLSNEKISKHLLGKIPMRRFGEVDEMTGAGIFLASPESNYMTGQTLVVDGGWTAE